MKRMIILQSNRNGWTKLGLKLKQSGPEIFHRNGPQIHGPWTMDLDLF